MKNRILFLMLALYLIFTLVGCSGGGRSSAPTNPTSKDTTSSSANTTKDSRSKDDTSEASASNGEYEYTDIPVSGGLDLTKYLGTDLDIIIPSKINGIPVVSLNVTFSKSDHCKDITSVVVPDSVYQIGYATFANCSSLVSVTLPNSVTNIGKEAFFGCTALTSITIPNGVTDIGNFAFDGCRSLPDETRKRIRQLDRHADFDD